MAWEFGKKGITTWVCKKHHIPYPCTVLFRGHWNHMMPMDLRLRMMMRFASISCVVWFAWCGFVSGVSCCALFWSVKTWMLGCDVDRWSRLAWRRWGRGCFWSGSWVLVMLIFLHGGFWGRWRVMEWWAHRPAFCDAGFSKWIWVNMWVRETVFTVLLWDGMGRECMSRMLVDVLALLLSFCISRPTATCWQWDIRNKSANLQNRFDFDVAIIQTGKLLRSWLAWFYRIVAAVWIVANAL